METSIQVVPKVQRLFVLLFPLSLFYKLPAAIMRDSKLLTLRLRKSPKIRKAFRSRFEWLFAFCMSTHVVGGWWFHPLCGGVTVKRNKVSVGVGIFRPHSVADRVTLQLICRRDSHSSFHVALSLTNKNPPAKVIKFFLFN